MKNIILVFFTFTLIITTGCLTDRSDKSIPNTPEEPAETLETNEISESVSDDDERLLIAKEVLGDLIFREMSIEMFDDLGDSSAKSISTSFDASIKKITQEFSIDSSSGSMIVNTNGTLETIASYGASGSVYYYSPLYVRIQFEDFTSKPPELGAITVAGNLNCFFQGRFESPTKKAIGNGKCLTGDYENVSPLLVTCGGKQFNIIYSVNFKVLGEPFEIESYQFTGTMTVDDQEIDTATIFDSN